KEEDRFNIIKDMIRNVTLGYTNDTITKVNEYLSSKKLGENLIDYIKKRELMPYFSASMLGTEVLPSEDSEVNHQSKLSLFQEKRQRDIIMDAIKNPEKFLSNYEKD